MGWTTDSNPGKKGEIVYFEYDDKSINLNLISLMDKIFLLIHISVIKEHRGVYRKYWEAQGLYESWPVSER